MTRMRPPGPPATAAEAARGKADPVNAPRRPEIRHPRPGQRHPALARDRDRDDAPRISATARLRPSPEPLRKPSPPAGSSRQHELEAVAPFVTRPPGEERRASQAGHQRTEREERELEDTRWLQSRFGTGHDVVRSRDLVQRSVSAWPRPRSTRRRRPPPRQAPRSVGQLSVNGLRGPPAGRQPARSRRPWTRSRPQATTPAPGAHSHGRQEPGRRPTVTPAIGR
jgi:hypothetical protein